MRRLKAQIDNELSGVRVSPELKRRLLRAAQREARRQRRRHVLALGGSVAGIAAALVLVCGLALMTRGYRLVPGGGSGDPIRPLSPGQPAETGIPPLSNPNETPGVYLPTASPTKTAETLYDPIYARLVELTKAQDAFPSEAQLQQAAKELADLPAQSDDPTTWLAPIHDVLVGDLGMSEAFVKDNGLVNEFVVMLSESISSENEAYDESTADPSSEESKSIEQPAEALSGPSQSSAGEALEDQIRARLIELADAQGVTYAELQLREVSAELASVTALDDGPDAWIDPIHRILTDDLAVSEAFIDDNDLVIDFAEYLYRSAAVHPSSQPTAEPAPESTEIAEPTAEARQPIFREETMNYSWLSENVMQALFTVEEADSDTVSQMLRGATLEIVSPKDDSLSSTVRKNVANDGANVLYQLIRSEPTKGGIRVLFMAVLDDLPDEHLTLRIRDADGGVIAENLSLMGDSAMQTFSIGLQSYEEYGGVTDNGLSGDLRMGDGGVLLVPPMAILAVDLEEIRLYCPSESGPVYYHASSLCSNLGKGARSTQTPDDCEAMGFAPCPVCMPEGEAPYTWEGWTMEGTPFNDCAVVPTEDGARLFGWTTMEAFVAHAQKIGGSGTLNMALSGQRGAGAMAYDRALLQFDSRMTSYGMQSARQFVSDAPTYEEFMGIQ